jgi:phosphopentomutase
MIKRAIVIVIDGFGVGNAPDVKEYGDEGSNTLEGVYNNAKLNIPNLKKLGLYNIDGLNINEKEEETIGCYGRCIEKSAGKNSPVGHWEMAGYINEKPFKTYPLGFPEKLLNEFKDAIGVSKILCNEVGSGTDILKRYGEEHVATGYPIVYTSADSVFQIEAHEDVIPVSKLYEWCEKARKIADKEEYNIGTIIARPFVGTCNEDYTRTYNRKDFESQTFGRNMLDVIYDAKKDVIAIGKIEDLFSGRGITKVIRTSGNKDGLEKTVEEIKRNTEGLIFTNLVDTDMLYGHRNNIEGYAKALEEIDSYLPEIEKLLNEDDILIITGDHGNDPSTPSTDHSREMTPLLVYGKSIKKNINIGTRETFADIAATILDELNLEDLKSGRSFKDIIE